MATTETRPGFRLPWTSDHREPRAGDDTDTTEQQAGAATADEAAVDPSQASTAESPEDSVTPTFAASPTPAADVTDGHSAAGAPAAHAAPQTARPRPTKFLADLTKAMQAAAQAEREEMLRQYRDEAKAFVEQYRADAAGRATTYRKEADEDVAGIRDWSKAEMARIREETERRIAGRKAELESELQDHGDRVERAVQRVESRVEAYETEMAAFFERLLVVDDPTSFAAMAANMPEPPPFSPEPLPTDVPARRTDRDESADAAQVDTEAPQAIVGDAEAVVEAVARPEQGLETAAEPADAGPSDAATPADSAWAGATWSSDGSAPGGPDGDAAAANPSDPHATGEAADQTAAGAAPVATLPAGLTEEPVDPRLAALGLTPDFAAAEAEAAVDLSGDGSDDAEGVVPVDDQALAARIAGLVAGSGAGTTTSGETRTTPVVVVGLVSVASIAGFKRTLAHVAGVQSVSVSSGPDGEFIFSTVHHDADLPSAIAALPGFDARVTESDDGVLHVAAHDPESAS